MVRPLALMQLQSRQLKILGIGSGLVALLAIGIFAYTVDHARRDAAKRAKQWETVQQFIAKRTAGDWEAAYAAALALSEASDTPELKAMALFAAAYSAENAGRLADAEAELDQVVIGAASSFVPLARIEKARFAILNGKVDDGKKQLDVLLTELNASADAALIDWIHTIELWTETLN